MEFRILGPVQVLDRQQVVPVPTGRVRSLLAVLLLRANEVVTVPTLVDQLWGESPPTHPRATVQTYIGRLRQAMGEMLIQTRPGGYLLVLDPAQLDLIRFRNLVEQAARAADPVDQGRLLTQALDLWHGQPLAGITSESLLRDELPRLLEEKLHAVEHLLDVRLRLGEHAQVVAQLTSLTQEHPLRERFCAQLMLALYRCGRQADALQAYQTISRLLTDELGIDPGEQLQHLHQAILTADPQLDAPPTPSAPPTAPEPPVPPEAPATPEPPAPPEPSKPQESQEPQESREPSAETVSRERCWVTQCQLPLDVADFVGRDKATAEILSLIRTPDPRPTVLIMTISGPPGVGKSALAIRTAHALRDDFPDGQWYLRLKGAGGGSRSPGELLDNLLRNTGVEPTAIPVDVQARAALFRARVADRRLLLVLDDAVNTGQVEQLLPGTSGCVVIITSRCELSGLMATHGARRLAVSGLAPHEAQELLVRTLGRQRVAAQPDAAADIARLCGHLPLALRIAAANLAARPDISLARYAADLGGTDRLDKLICADDPPIAVRAAFALSYAALDGAPQRAFRLLGVFPGQNFDTYAAAALLGISDQDAQKLLDQLTAANLVERHGVDQYGVDQYGADQYGADQYEADRYEADRYGLHDLIRLYAAERAAADEPESAAEAARHRLLDWYLHSTNAAVAVRHAAVAPPVLPEPADGIRPRTFETARDALAWLDAERANLVAAISDAVDSARSGHASLLAGVLRSYFDGRCHFDEWSTALAAGLRAAECADSLCRIRLHNDQGVLHWRKGRYADAITSFNSALAVGTESGTRDIEGRVLNNLGAVHNELLLLNEAAYHLNRALDSQQCFAAEHRANRSTILANLGGVYSNLGELEPAMRCARESLAVAREDGAQSWYCEGLARETLGDIYLQLGELEPAREHLSTALGIFRKAGFRTEENYILNTLSAVHRAAGRHALALEYGHLALDTFQEINNRRYMTDSHNSIGATLHRLHHPAQACEHFVTARDIAVEVDHPRGRIVALIGLALAGHAVNPGAGHVHYAAQALILAQRARQAVLQGAALDALARITLSENRYADAADYGARAIAVHRRTGCRGMLADALVVQARTQAGQGRMAAARPLWREALTLYEALDSSHAAEVRRELVRGELRTYPSS